MTIHRIETKAGQIESAYRAVVKEMIMSGEIKDKRHGSWIFKPLTKTKYLMMDSWNGSVYLMSGLMNYCYWKGSSDERIAFLGGDFGGYIQGQNHIYLFKTILETMG